MRFERNQYIIERRQRCKSYQYRNVTVRRHRLQPNETTQMEQYPAGT